MDEVGTFDEAIDELLALMGVESAQIVEHRRKPGLLDLFMGVSSREPSLQAIAAGLLESTTGARFLVIIDALCECALALPSAG